MKNCTAVLICLLVTVFALPVCSQQYRNPPYNQAGVAIQALEKDIPKFMREADVPGLSAALIRDGKLVWMRHFGFQNADTKIPVTDSTIFEAASLTKIVTAYAVLKLVDQGQLDLDTPLNKYLGNNYDVGDDPRIHRITARRVLSHSAGFPNWRSRDSKTLPILFTPGEKFSYSGEGFVYLGRVVEHMTGKKFEDVVAQTVFQPLGMKNSSLVWQDHYQRWLIHRHDWTGKVSFRAEYKEANAAASMRTTATDYARFVTALLNGEGLKKKTWQEMLTSQIRVNDTSRVSWGLGLGLQTNEAGKSFWHWGDQGDSKCFVTALVEPKDAFVYFTNSSNGLSFTPEILVDALGGPGDPYPAVAWLNYKKHDPAGPRLLASITEQGAAGALKTYREKRGQPGDKGLDESIINQIGYKLIALKKIDDAIEVMTRNTTDFPESSNAWDSLAEAHMIKGNKELAIQYYQKSLDLDPGNTNAIEQLKKLRS